MTGRKRRGFTQPSAEYRLPIGEDEGKTCENLIEERRAKRVKFAPGPYEPGRFQGRQKELTLIGEDGHPEFTGQIARQSGLPSRTHYLSKPPSQHSLDLLEAELGPEYKLSIQRLRRRGKSASKRRNLAAHNLLVGLFQENEPEKELDVEPQAMPSKPGGAKLKCTSNGRCTEEAVASEQHSSAALCEPLYSEPQQLAQRQPNGVDAEDIEADKQKSVRRSTRRAGKSNSKRISSIDDTKSKAPKDPFRGYRHHIDYSQDPPRPFRVSFWDLCGFHDHMDESNRAAFLSFKTSGNHDSPWYIDDLDEEDE